MSAVVFQNVYKKFGKPELFKKLSPYENLQCGTKLYGLSGEYTGKRLVNRKEEPVEENP